MRSISSSKISYFSLLLYMGAELLFTSLGAITEVVEIILPATLTGDVMSGNLSHKTSPSVTGTASSSPLRLPL